MSPSVVVVIKPKIAVNFLKRYLIKKKEEFPGRCGFPRLLLRIIKTEEKRPDYKSFAVSGRSVRRLRLLPPQSTQCGHPGPGGWSPRRHIVSGERSVTTQQICFISRPANWQEVADIFVHFFNDQFTQMASPFEFFAAALHGEQYLG